MKQCIKIIVTVKFINFKIFNKIILYLYIIKYAWSDYLYLLSYIGLGVDFRVDRNGWNLSYISQTNSNIELQTLLADSGNFFIYLLFFAKNNVPLNIKLGSGFYLSVGCVKTDGEIRKLHCTLIIKIVGILTNS